MCFNLGEMCFNLILLRNAQVTVNSIFFLEKQVNYSDGCPDTKLQIYSFTVLIVLPFIDFTLYCL